MLLAACLLTPSSCTRQKKTQQWGELEYEMGQVLSPAEQIAAQRALQADASSLTDPHQLRPGSMIGLTMSEEQRRRFQRRRAETLFERASGHQREAERRWKETLEAQRASNAGGRRGG